MLLFLKYLCCPSKEFQHLENFTNMESHSLLHFAILEKCFCVIQMNDWTQLYYFFFLECFWLQKRLALLNVKSPKPCFLISPSEHSLERSGITAHGSVHAVNTRGWKIAQTSPHALLKPAKLPALLNNANCPPPMNSILGLSECSPMLCIACTWQI